MRSLKTYNNYELISQIGTHSQPKEALSGKRPINIDERSLV